MLIIQMLITIITIKVHNYNYLFLNHYMDFNHKLLIKLHHHKFILDQIMNKKDHFEDVQSWEIYIHLLNVLGIYINNIFHFVVFKLIIS